MLTPTLLLLLGIVVVVASVLFFWPPSGLWWRWRHGLPDGPPGRSLPVRERPRAEMPPPRRALSSLAPGETALVEDFSPVIQGVQRRRLLDLGLVPGTRVEAVRVGPGGDPTAYRIRGAVIALRREQTERIHIARPETAGGAA